MRIWKGGTQKALKTNTIPMVGNRTFTLFLTGIGLGVHGLHRAKNPMRWLIFAESLGENLIHIDQWDSTSIYGDLWGFNIINYGFFLGGFNIDRLCASPWWSHNWEPVKPGLQDFGSGKQTVCYWTWSCIVDLPIKSGDFPIVIFQRLPEGNSCITNRRDSAAGPGRTALPRHTSSAIPHRPGRKPKGYPICEKTKDIGVLKKQSEEHERNWWYDCLVYKICLLMSVVQRFSKEHIDEDCGLNQNESKWDCCISGYKQIID